MIRYKSFSISEEKKINEFIKEHAHGIAQDSITFVGEMICFLYTDDEVEEIMKKNLMGSVKQFIAQRSAEILGKEIDVRYFQGLSLKVTPKAEERLMQVSTERDNLCAQLRHAKVLLSEIEKGTWIPEIANQNRFDKK